MANTEHYAAKTSTHVKDFNEESEGLQRGEVPQGLTTVADDLARPTAAAELLSDMEYSQHGAQRRNSLHRLTPPLNFQSTSLYVQMYSSRPRQAHSPARTAHPRPARSAHQTGFLQPTRVPGACLAAAAARCPRPCAPCTKASPCLPRLQAFSSMNSLSRLQIKAE